MLSRDYQTTSFPPMSATMVTPGAAWTHGSLVTSIFGNESVAPLRDRLSNSTAVEVDLDAFAIPMLVQRVRELSRTDRPRAFDDLFATIDAHGHQQRWSDLNRLFLALDWRSDSVELLIAGLTATIPWKRDMDAQRRETFVKSVRARLTREVGPERTDRILRGRE